MDKGLWGFKPEIRLELMPSVDFTGIAGLRVAFRGANLKNLCLFYGCFIHFATPKAGPPSANDGPKERRKEK